MIFFSIVMFLISALCVVAYLVLRRPLIDFTVPNMEITSPLPSVKAVGRDVVDASGKIVKLRGVNAAWFAPRSGTCGFKGLNTDWDYFNVSDSRFGEEKSTELFKTWNDNYFVDQDFNMIAAMGYNFIRIPLHYRNFQYRNSTWIRKSNGLIDFDQLEKFVAMAGRYGVYAQLDFSVWNGREVLYEGISKADPNMSVEDTRQTRMWRQQAVDFMGNVTKNFIGNPNILGMDIVNEPVPSYGDLLMILMYERMRRVDRKM
jgi:endoglucanase